MNDLPPDRPPADRPPSAQPPTERPPAERPPAERVLAERPPADRLPGRPASPLPGDRRRYAWREFRHAYPGLIVTMALALAILLGINGWLWYKSNTYRQEIARLRGGMTDVERRRTDMELKAGANAIQVQLELLRRQARQDAELHLSVSMDSATMYLEQGSAQLRVMPVEIGPEKTIGEAPDTVRLVAPRGQRTIERILGARDAFALPAWVWRDRGLETPADLSLPGAAGPVAIVLSGGTVIYSMPSAGPLNDSSYVMPGNVRARASDLRAIAPNLKPGQTVYFY